MFAKFFGLELLFFILAPILLLSDCLIKVYVVKRLKYSKIELGKDDKKITDKGLKDLFNERLIENVVGLPAFLVLIILLGLNYYGIISIPAWVLALLGFVITPTVWIITELIDGYRVKRDGIGRKINYKVNDKNDGDTA